jgi:hypothetical protein
VTVRRAGPDQHVGQSPCQCVTPDDVLIQLFPPDDVRLSLETCRGRKINTLKKVKKVRQVGCKSRISKTVLLFGTMSIVVGVFKHKISGTTVIRYEGWHLAECLRPVWTTSHSSTYERELEVCSRFVFSNARPSHRFERSKCFHFRVKQSKKSDVLKVRSQGERSGDGWVDVQWELNCLD